MNKIKVLIVMAFTLLLAGCSIFGDRSGYEQLDYTVVEKIQDIEIRNYPKRIAVEIADAKDDREAFFALFDYISGKNIGQSKISMTSPVEVAPNNGTQISMTSPVEKTKGSDNKVHMRFFLPKDYSQENTPLPTNPRLKIVFLPQELFAVLTYSGTSSDEKFKSKSDELKNLLATTKYRYSSLPTFLGYDPPFTIPFLKRNEVAIKLD